MCSPLSVRYGAIDIMASVIITIIIIIRPLAISGAKKVYVALASSVTVVVAVTDRPLGNYGNNKPRRRKSRAPVS